MTRPLVESHIAKIAPYQPGKPIEELLRELGQAAPKGGVVKLASNENPLGPSPHAVAAARAALDDVHRYPDGGCFALRQRLCRLHGVSEDEILLAAGSNEVINLIVQTFCAADEEVIAPAYSFLCYGLAAEILGRRFRQTAVGAGFAYDVDALLSSVTPKTKIVFVANPNNPTGTYLAEREFLRLAKELPPEVILAVDEAYFEYVRAPDYPSVMRHRSARQRMISIRTFSKVFGLAGLRIGYAIMPSELSEYVQRVRMPFNLNLIGQAAALAALDDAEHVSRSLALNHAQMDRLLRDLSRLGLSSVPSQGNFLLVDFARHGARRVYDALLRHGVIVRPVANYGLPDHLRITVGTQVECDRLIAGLEQSLS